MIAGRDRGALNRITGRFAEQIAAAPPEERDDIDNLTTPNQRWRIDQRWIEFDCGCRAERCQQLREYPMDWDPVIFRNLPEQAVYDDVCDLHGPSMNKYVGFGGFVTFDQWKRERRDALMGR